MRSPFIAGIAIIGLSTAAIAGEGNGDPFPGVDMGVTTKVSAANMAARSQDPYQYRPTGAPVVLNGYVAAASASQDPFPYKVAGRQANMPTAATATASTASPSSVAQRMAAPGTRG